MLRLEDRQVIVRHIEQAHAGGRRGDLASESSFHRMLRTAGQTALAEDIHTAPAKPVLHGDNGSTLKATTVLAMLH